MLTITELFQMRLVYSQENQNTRVSNIDNLLDKLFKIAEKELDTLLQKPLEETL